jgi:protein TonB
LANHAAQPVAARAGPPEIQNVQYARPIMLDYPPVSRRLNESGVVIVRVLIDPDGKPVEVIVQKSSGHSRLDAAAVAAVRRALFRPYRENGVALPAQTLVPIRFELG